MLENLIEKKNCSLMIILLLKYCSSAKPEKGLVNTGDQKRKIHLNFRIN